MIMHAFRLRMLTPYALPLSPRVRTQGALIQRERDVVLIRLLLLRWRKETRIEFANLSTLNERPEFSGCPFPPRGAGLVEPLNFPESEIFGPSLWGLGVVAPEFLFSWYPTRIF